MRTLYSTLWAGVALALVGCQGKDPGQQGDPAGATGETGMALMTAVNEGGSPTGVAQMQYAIDRIACVQGETFDPLHRSITVQLENIMIPGGITAFENSPLDKSSAHPFSDHFEVVPAGCYDVRGTPLGTDGNASTECAPAWSNGTKVNNGLTTEIFLISQCKGAAVGAVDSVIALNQPPELTQLTFTPSKFIVQGTSAQVCATAHDPNGDPMQFAWAHLDNQACNAPAVVSNNGSTECVTIAPMNAGSYQFQVTIYDLIHDETGKLVRVEDWLRAHGYPNDSHASLQFPLYVAPSVAVGTSL
jgi:hypothetical protein